MSTIRPLFRSAAVREWGAFVSRPFNLVATFVWGCLTHVPSLVGRYLFAMPIWAEVLVTLCGISAMAIGLWLLLRYLAAHPTEPERTEHEQMLDLLAEIRDRLRDSER